MSNNKMLIDATHPEETRVVVLRGGRVEEFDYESAARKLLRGNIYLAKVTRVEPSLQAAFVDYGGNRHGFLAFNEIHPDYYQIPMADRQALLDEEAAAEAEEEAAADARAEALARRRALREQSRQSRRRDSESGEGEDNGSDEGEEGYDSGADEQPYEVRPHGEGEDDEPARDEEESDDRSRQRRRRGRNRRGRGGGEMRGRGDRGGERGDDDHRGQRFSSGRHSDEGREGAHVGSQSAEAGHEPHDAGHGHDVSEHDHDHGHAHDHSHDHAHGAHDHSQDHEAHGHEADHHHDHDHRHDNDAGSPGDHGGAEPVRTLSEARGLADDRRSEPTPTRFDDVHDASRNMGVFDGDETVSVGVVDAVPTSKGNVEGVQEVNGAAEAEAVDEVGSEDALEELPSRQRRRPRSYKIQEVIKRRQIILVQVVKEERGNKGAALTTYLSLAGRYTVLMPNTARGGGISRKITQPQDRKRLKAIAASLEVPEGMGLIIRTAGAARTAQEIKRDFEYLLRLWESVRDLTLQSVAPSLVYEEGNLIKRSIRDLYNKDIDEIIVAGNPAHAEAHDFMRMLMPSQAKNVINYREPEPLFTRFQIERQLNAMFSPYVTLRSGGYLVINQTEALVAVDVNSGRSTREFSIEETALNTNLEAAEEIARQLKLRDLAGLIVIDFIDMEERRNNRRVENRLKDALRFDRARIQVGRISHFGLMEMSRQRLRTGVLEGSTSQCPHCQGTGIIRSTESVALAVLRGLEDAIMAGARTSLIATTTPTVALYILNNKRSFIIDMERRTGLPIVVQGSDKMQGANFTIEKGAAPALAVRRPERSAVNMEWGFEGEADDGDVDAEVGAADPGFDDVEPSGRDEAQRNGNGEDGGRRRRRRRRRGRRGDRPEGADGAMLGQGDDFIDDANGGDDRDGVNADGDEDDVRDDASARGRGGHRRGERRDAVAEESAEAAPHDASDDGDGDEPGLSRDGGDGSRRRGRRRGRRGGRRGRERDRGTGPFDRSEDLSTTGYASAFDYGHGVDWPAATPVEAADDREDAGLPVSGQRGGRSGRHADEAAHGAETVHASSDASAEAEVRHVQPGPAAAAAEAMIAAKEVEETSRSHDAAAADVNRSVATVSVVETVVETAVVETVSPAEPAPRRRSTQSSEPRIERVVVRPDAAETQEVNPAAAAAPRKGWWSRKLLG